MAIHNILIISAHYYPIKGGTATHTENLCCELSKLGCAVTLITEDKPISNRDTCDAAQPYRVVRVKAHRFFSGDSFFPLLVCKHLKQYIRESKPDIINVSTGNYMPIYLKMVKNRHIPIVYTVHNVPPEEYSFNICNNSSLNSILKKIYFGIIVRIYKMCIKYGRYTHIISVSERTKERLLRAGADSSQISIVSNGIAKPKFESICVEKDGEKWFTILVTAGIIEHKGQYELLLAFDEIIKVIPNARCVLVGPTRSEAYADKIRKFIAENGYGDRIILQGEVSGDELERQYAQCDLYVQPSYQEGFCIAIMEAMIRGKPVIGTAVGAIPELLADGRGIVIEKPEPKLISDAIIKMYSDVLFRQESARKAKEYVMKEYEWSRVAKETVNVYEYAQKKLASVFGLKNVECLK